MTTLMGWLNCCTLPILAVVSGVLISVRKQRQKLYLLKVVSSQILGPARQPITCVFITPWTLFTANTIRLIAIESDRTMKSLPIIAINTRSSLLIDSLLCQSKPVLISHISLNHTTHYLSY